MTREVSIEGIASELYAGPLDEFIPARNDRAREAASVDPALAARIRELRKPSVAAWVVNVFAVERRAQLDDALQLAEQLRDAQEDLDAKALSQLGRDRRALTAQLASLASDLAEARGERVTAATRESVQQTLSAAFFDADAAAAVSSGRLVRALEPRGTFAESMESIVGGGAPLATARAEKPIDEVDARRRRRDAERLVRETEQTRDRAARGATAAARALREAEADAEALSSRAVDLEKELAAARQDMERAGHAMEGARTAQQDAAARLAEAEKALRRAEAALEHLDG
ncbi:transposase [Microbacterium sp. UFMG61]|jgi:DNA repair exonuclease SbcCD ATPase subunit|uniref:transposase n=1 Tax=Microbacterium sp. UFMG61 TaxID=2745935 RepID=UPI00188F5B8C|nr:transposase [Microbacterium sp. UFMG61]